MPPLSMTGDTTYGPGGTANVATQISGLEGLDFGGVDWRKLLSGINLQPERRQQPMLAQAPRPAPVPQAPRETWGEHMTPQGITYKTYETGPRAGQTVFGAGSERYGYMTGTPYNFGR